MMEIETEIISLVTKLKNFLTNFKIRANFM